MQSRLVIPNVLSEAHQLQEKLGDPEVAGNSTEYQRIAKAAAGLQEVVDTFHRACQVEKDISEAKHMLKDSAGQHREQRAESSF